MRRATPRVEGLERLCLLTCGTISGHVYLDSNNNGLLDSGEPLFANQPIELHRGDASGPVIGHATTDANGFYQFTLDETVPSSASTAPATASFSGTTDYSGQGLTVPQFDPELGTLTSVEISYSGGITSQAKVESMDATPTTITDSFTGNVFLDLGGTTDPLSIDLTSPTETFDATEFDGTVDFAGTSGTVFDPLSASDSTSTVLTDAASLAAFTGTGTFTAFASATAVSQATGSGNLVTIINTNATTTLTVIYHYIPDNCLEPGQYTVVQVTEPPGTIDGKESQGGVVLPDAGRINDTIPVTLTDAQPNSTGNDFGELLPANGTIMGVVFTDCNTDGVVNGDEGTEAIPGVTVFLDTNGNGTLDSGETSTTSGPDGSFSFSNLAPGAYHVRQVVPTGFKQTTANSSLDVNVVGNGSANVAIGDVGLKSAITNYSFLVNNTTTYTDLRGHIHQADQVQVTFTLAPGVSHYEITLVSYEAPGSSFDANTASQQEIFDEASGFFDAGTHTLTVQIPNCFFQVDFVVACAIEQLGPAGSNNFYTPQGRLISADNGGTQACPPNGGDITGTKFEDHNGNGIRDAGDQGLAGWQIYIDANNNGKLDSGEYRTFTQADGSYRFGDVAPGNYKIREVQQSGWVNTTPLPRSATVTAGHVTSGVDIGNFHTFCISGQKFNDKNGDGIKGSGEGGLSGVTIFLDTNNNGKLDSGETSTTTDSSGNFSFSNLGPGTYLVREQVPSGWSKTTPNPGAVVGSSGVNVSGLKFGDLQGTCVAHGQTATIGFWANNNGQALIKSFNGGPASTQLATWLATTFPKLYGPGTPNNLTGKTNADVAALFIKLKGVSGQKLDAQVLANALAVYATTSSLGGSAATSYGFTVSTWGVGAATFNVGSNGSAFGVPDNTTLTVMQVLNSLNDQAVSGVLYGGNSTKRNMANTVTSGINQAGDIT